MFIKNMNILQPVCNNLNIPIQFNLKIDSNKQFQMKDLVYKELNINNQCKNQISFDLFSSEIRMQQLDQEIDFKIAQYIDTQIQLGYKYNITKQLIRLTGIHSQEIQNTQVLCQQQAKHKQQLVIISFIQYFNALSNSYQKQLSNLKQNCQQYKIQMFSLKNINSSLLNSYKKVMGQFNTYKIQSTNKHNQKINEIEQLMQNISIKQLKIRQLQTINYQLSIRNMQIKQQKQLNQNQFNQFCLSINSLVSNVTTQLELKQTMSLNFDKMQKQLQKNTNTIIEHVYNCLQFKLGQFKSIQTINKQVFVLIQKMNLDQMENEEQQIELNEEKYGEFERQKSDQISDLIQMIFNSIKQTIKLSGKVNQQTSKKLQTKMYQIQELYKRIQQLNDKINQLQSENRFISLNQSNQQQFQSSKKQIQQNDKQNSGNSNNEQQKQQQMQRSPIQILNNRSFISSNSLDKFNNVNQFVPEQEQNVITNKSKQNSLNNAYHSLLQQNLKLKEQIFRIRELSIKKLNINGQIKRLKHQNSQQIKVKFDKQNNLKQSNTITKQNINKQKVEFDSTIAKYRQNLLNLNQIINYIMNILKGYYNPFSQRKQQHLYNGHIRQNSYLYKELLNEEEQQNYVNQLNSTLNLNKKVGQISNIVTRHNDSRSKLHSKHLSKQILKQKYENFQFIRKLCISEKNCKELIGKFNLYTNYYFQQIKSKHNCEQNELEFVKLFR